MSRSSARSPSSHRSNAGAKQADVQPSIPGETVPTGGVVATPRLVRGFHWHADGGLVCAPLRCRKEQWYFMRCQPKCGARIDLAEVCVSFHSGGEPAGQCRVLLHAIAGDSTIDALYGWFETPGHVTHFQFQFAAGESTGLFDHIGIFPTNERAAVSHPPAVIPRGAYRPPEHIRSVILPASLESVSGDLEGRRAVVVSRPRSIEALLRRVCDAAWVLDPAWVNPLQLGWNDLERLAQVSWLIVDLDTVAALLLRDVGVKVAVERRTSDRELPCAKVVYADTPTRGFALHDVLPYATVAPDGSFAVRAMSGDRSWHRYADESGFVTLLGRAQSSSERHPDVLSAARPMGRGKLLANDLPWLVAGQYGPLVAPRLARHLLNMHLAGPLDDALQYWAPTREPQVLLREIAEMQRHFRALRPIRWATGKGGVMHLGLSLENGSVNGTRRHLLVQTGRIDACPGATSLPAEAMMCYMKHLAAQSRDATGWAKRQLAGLTVTWQFDSVANEQFRHIFCSADAVSGSGSATPRVVGLVDCELNRVPESFIAGAKLLRINVRHGVLGDGSLEYQRELSRLLCAEIEACG